MCCVGNDGGALTNENGEITSHLQGMFYRTIRMMDNGIKPVYVFDGKPPEMKGGELEKRSAIRQKAREDLKEAKESENRADEQKYEKRLVHVSKEQNQEAIRLLRLMGVPVVEAPSEAEAQCSALCAAGLSHSFFLSSFLSLVTLVDSTLILIRVVFLIRSLPILYIYIYIYIYTV